MSKDSKKEMQDIVDELFEGVVQSVKKDMNKILRFEYKNQIKFYILMVVEHPDDDDFNQAVLMLLLKEHGPKVITDILDTTDKMSEK